MRLQISILACFFIGSLALPVEHISRTYDPSERDPFRITTVSWMDENGQIHNDTLTAAMLGRKTQGSLKDVTLMLYTSANPYDAEVINPNERDQLVFSKYFDPKRSNFFIVHGWRNDYTSPVNVMLRDALLDLNDVNVFVVHWGDMAHRNYFSAKDAVAGIGAELGQFLQGFVEHYKLTSKDVALIGHSLGAHVAGGAGAAMTTKPRFIIGLDPAGPFYDIDNIDERLDPSDAEYVQVVHTSGSKLSFRSSLGHADFYPNGGNGQPGCGLDLLGTCAHSRSYMLMAETLYFCASISHQCTSYEDYTDGLCADNLKSHLGCYNVDRKIRGDFYLNTNDEQPFFVDSTDS